MISDVLKQIPIPTTWDPLGVARAAPTFIYGTGTVGRDVYRVLTGRGVPIAGFIDHMRSDVPALREAPVFRPDDTRLPAELRSQAVVVLAIHNREVDVAALIKSLRRLGYRHLVSMIDLYDHFADELGERYWLTRRTLYASHEAEIRSAYELLSDQPSRSLYSAIVRFRITGDYSVLPSPDREHQYAPPDIPAWGTPLRLVDCGAYDGDSLNGFLRATTSIEAVAAFEPDLDSFSRLCRFVREHGDDFAEAYLWPCAVGSATRAVRFDRGRGEASALASAGDTAVPSVALDDVLYGFSANLIKVDVEGAEREVILGARNIIAKTAPGLAICVYHRPEDIWGIPLLIEELGSGSSPQARYRYYLRLHAHSSFDLVLYAVPVASRIS